jgi:hypothetical protein
MLRAFKNWCKLIGNRSVIRHDLIPPTVSTKQKEPFTPAVSDRDVRRFRNSGHAEKLAYLFVQLKEKIETLAETEVPVKLGLCGQYISLRYSIQ